MTRTSPIPATTLLFQGHRGPVYALLDMDADHFLSGSGDGLVVRWSLKAPERGEVIVDVGQAIFALHRLPDERHLLIGTEGGGVHMVDLRTGKEVHLYTVHRKGAFAFMDLPGDRLVVSGGDGSISIWSTAVPGRLDLQRQIPISEAKVRGLALSPDRTLLAVADGDGPVHLLDSADMNEVHTLSGHEGGSLCALWHPTKPALLTGGKDGHLRTWHAGEDYRPLLALPAHEAGIYALAFAKERPWLASASRDKTAKIWHLDTLEPLIRLDRRHGGHTHSVNALLWKGERPITAGDDKKILCWAFAPDPSPASEGVEHRDQEGGEHPEEET